MPADRRRMGLRYLIRRTLLASMAVALAAVFVGVIPPQPPKPTDPDVALMDFKFGNNIDGTSGLSVNSKGSLRRDRHTFFWSLFTDKFGANPNTPYMWSALPLIGFLLPSPMWNLGEKDAVVLLARKPPTVEYFSFTTFALFMPRRSKPILPFSSLGDSVNNYNIKHAKNGLFAHVVTANEQTYRLVERALVASGLPKSAINLLAVPSGLGLFDDVLHLGNQVRLGTYFEVVLRLFRFENQTAGDEYILSHPPVYYIKGEHEESKPLAASATPSYKTREHEESVREGPLAEDFATHSTEALAKVSEAFGHSRGSPPLAEPLTFTPLMIRGLECLEKDTECLGDCPDAAYYGPNVHADTDGIEMLQLKKADELHLVTAVNHRQLKAAIYGSIAILKPHPVSSPILSKARMSVRATSIGVTSFEFNSTNTFITWAFTRNAKHCERLSLFEGAVDGCSVVEESHVPRDGYLTYCERVYLNPITGLGPHWDNLLPAKIYTLNGIGDGRPPASPQPLPTGLPPSLPLAKIEDGSDTMRFFHIIKTGGESLELHLAEEDSPPPKLDYSHCRMAATRPGLQYNMTSLTNPVCAAASAGVSAALCAFNCECCAADARVENGFNGVLIRSPRAHMLSLFSHCHTAHTKVDGFWKRVADDPPQYLAEIILRSTEWSCGTYCGQSFEPDWEAALKEGLKGDPKQARDLRVLPLHNTQAHAMTCSTRQGSLGQHFRVLDDARGGGGGDALAPQLQDALDSLRSFEWVGLTDLMEHSLCVLHFQASGKLPSECQCSASTGRLGLVLPRFNHGVVRHDPSSLSEETLALIDAHTEVDAQLFAEALRLLLGRLKAVEEATGASLLACLDWKKLYKATGHIKTLWRAEGEFIG